MASDPPEDAGETPGEFSCDACGASFDSEAELRAHVRRAGIVE